MQKWLFIISIIGLSVMNQFYKLIKNPKESYLMQSHIGKKKEKKFFVFLDFKLTGVACGAWVSTETGTSVAVAVDGAGAPVKTRIISAGVGVGLTVDAWVVRCTQTGITTSVY